MLDFAALKRDALVKALRQHLEGEVRFDDTSRLLYSTDASIYQVQPLGVVVPKTRADLTAAVQIASELEVSIVPRGGGTSLSGQSIGPGLIIDCSKYLNAVLEIDAAGRRARVQPGVVLDQLNRSLAPHDLQFGPDVATASRANLGGMIGNNSAGSRSIVYGKTGDHVLSLDVLLSDGSTARIAPLTGAQWKAKSEASTLEGAIYRQLRGIVAPHADEIRRRFPDIIRRVSGYNLLDFLAIQTDAGRQEPPKPSLLPLIVGSEGTLVVLAEAELNLVPRPRARGLLVPQFNSMSAALDALAACLEAGPSAVELLDAMLIELAGRNLALKGAMSAIQGKPAALLMVEFQGDDAGDVAARVERLQRKIASFPGVTACVPAIEADIRDPLWNLRRAAVPLLYGLPGDRKPITFVEDTAVAPARLPEFARRFREILHEHGTDGAFYGHASVGCLHIRPVLDLKEPADVDRMVRISEAVTDLVLEFHGSLSGEHGDGLVRSGWNRKMFGPTVYDLFRQIKRLFDPRHLLNPGKIVDAPPMTENLRTADSYPVERTTIFDYSRQEGFLPSIELCNGSGVCRKLQGGAMCPSYRATRDERDSTRGRANSLRIALENPKPSSGDALAERWIYDVMDLCLSCKACKSECPSNVDMAKLKAEFQRAYFEHHPRPLGHRILGHVHRVLRWSAPMAPMVNWFNRQPWARWALELIAGVDRRRSLPPVHSDHFRKWFRGHAPDENAGKSGRVILLDDCFTNWQEPQVARAAVRVLERAGYAVELAGIDCCGRALISKGFLLEARKLARNHVSDLARRVADGTPILGLEPSCVLTLADEWTELAPGADAQRVSAAAELADAWLAREAAAGRCSLPLTRRTGSCVLHGHCHQMALRGSAGSASALRMIPGWDVQVLDAGCCGMAGSFGYEAAHFEVSTKIASLQLLPALSASPNATVAATGTSCRHQIHDLAQRHARHPMELLEESMDGAVN